MEKAWRRPFCPSPLWNPTIWGSKNDPMSRFLLLFGSLSCCFGLFSAAFFMLSCCVLLHFAVFLLLFGSMSCCFGLFSLLFVVFSCFGQPVLLFFLLFCCIFAAFPLLFEVCPGVVVLGPFWLPFCRLLFDRLSFKNIVFLQVKRPFSKT